MIFLHSVHHTGTWFLLQFFIDHPDIKEWFTIEKFLELDHFPEHPYLVHCHMCLEDPDLLKDFAERPSKYLGRPLTDAFLNTYPSIIMLRDPLLAIITRHNRHPEMDHSFIIHGFMEIVLKYGGKVDKAELEEVMKSILKVREEARRNKDWVTADNIRKDLDDIGFEIQDTNDGPVWRKK